MKEHIDKYIIMRTVTVKEAMRFLDVSGKKILFVVNNDTSIYGSLTDGDIRRWILSGGNMESTIENVCNRNPHTLGKNYLISEVKKMMIDENIESIPVLDAKRKIYSLIFKEEVLLDHELQPSGRAIDVPVVIMAGGKGTRMEPFTNVLPKPLLPIGDKTILECIIDEFRKFSVSQYYVTLNYKGAMIEAYFNGNEKPYRIDFMKESDYWGTAGSLALLKGIVHGDIIVSNCDNIVKADYFEVLAFHRKYNSYVTILSSIQHHKIPYGVVSFREGGEVTEIIEKPEYSFTVNTGIYILNEKALECIPENSVFHMTHLIEALIKNNKKVMTYPVSENDFIDIGQWDDYRKVVDKLKVS
jgi:dTDP-glucose pyrophosphorylase